MCITATRMHKQPRRAMDACRDIEMVLTEKLLRNRSHLVIDGFKYTLIPDDTMRALIQTAANGRRR